MSEFVHCQKCNLQKATLLMEPKEGIKRYYCTSCKHTWSEGDQKKKVEEVSLGGVEEVDRLIASIGESLKLSTEIKATLVAQFTSVCLDKWYEGFKAGLMAQIVHEKEKEHDNGKNRNEHGSSNKEHRDGDRSAGKQNGEDRLGVSSTGVPSTSINRVKEKISGVELIRPSSLTLTESQYVEVAQIIEQFGGKDTVKRIEVSNGEFKLIPHAVL